MRGEVFEGRAGHDRAIWIASYTVLVVGETRVVIQTFEFLACTRIDVVLIRVLTLMRIEAPLRDEVDFEFARARITSNEVNDTTRCAGAIQRRRPSNDLDSLNSVSTEPEQTT